MERPLSAYVVISMMVSAVALYWSYQGLQSPPGCSSNFLYILIAFSVINILFAWFLQNQVWTQIMSHKDEFMDGDRPKEAYKGPIVGASQGMLGALHENDAESVAKEEVPANPGKIVIPSGVVSASFRKVFLEDFVVLAMFVALIFMFVLSWQGQSWVDEEGHCEIGSAQYCGYAFFWIAFSFSFAYSCCRCCSGSVTIKKPDEEEVVYSSVE